MSEMKQLRRNLKEFACLRARFLEAQVHIENAAEK